MQVRRRTRGRNRSGGDPAVRPSGASPVAALSIDATKLVLSFDIPVGVTGLPVGITCDGNPPTSFVQDTPMQITLEYAAAVIATNVVVIPENVAQIRTNSGGYVTAQTTELP
jgi:hypothetical protein